jgi:hypothetical protein
MDIAIIIAYLAESNAPVWFAILILLILYIYPKAGTVIVEKVIPARLQDKKTKLDAEIKAQDAALKKQDAADIFERDRLLRQEVREDRRIEAMENIGQTLVMMQAILEQMGKEHLEMISFLKKVDERSVDEHKSLVTLMNSLHTLFAGLLIRLEERRKTDFQPVPVQDTDK